MTSLPDVLPLPDEAVQLYFDDWLTYIAFDRKFLPRDGGFKDQPYLCMQVFQLLDGLLAYLTTDDEASDLGASSEET